MAADGANNLPADPVSNGSGYQGTDLLTRIGEWDQRIDAHWSGWREEALTCFDFVAGRQWSRTEIDEMETLSRIPIVFNRIAPTIDAVSGAEISNRQQVQYFPRQVGDTAIDDILTQGAEWIMDECEGNEEDSDAFRDALICGIGWTETRPDYDKDSRITKERVDPMEMTADPSSRKACFGDARFIRRKKPMSKEAFREMWPGQMPEQDRGLTSQKPVIVDPRIRYDGTNEDDTVSKDEVIVREYQWFDNEPRHLVGGVHGAMIKGQWPGVPMQSGMPKITPDQHQELMSQYPDAKTAAIKEKVFYRAFVSGQVVMESGPIEAEDFTYKAMTGKRDRNKNWYYGLVRPMMDPQKWANKLYSQLMHIFRSNANGGVIMEEGAALDQKEFEKSWADPAAITVVGSGVLSNPNGKKIEPKPTAEYPAGMDKLMEVAVAAIRDTTGVNQEMLGAADAQAQKAGILEQMRTRQAFGILAAFFDSKRRYHKMQGRLLLKMISLYLPQDKLVRVTGTDNNPQYVPLALSKDASEYDVVVDEAPGGPNQKTLVFQILLQLMPLLQNAGMGADVWAEIARASPLPAKLSEKIAADLIAREKAQQQVAPVQQQLQQQSEQAKIANDQGSAAHHQAQAQLLTAKAAQTHLQTATETGNPEPAPPPPNAKDEAQTNLDRAKTGKLLAETVTELEGEKDTK